MKLAETSNALIVTNFQLKTEIIRQGAFGYVYTTDYKGPGDAKCETVVIKKMLQDLDKGEKKVKLLMNDLQGTFHRIKRRKWGKWRGPSFPDLGCLSFLGLRSEFRESDGTKTR